MAPTYTREEKEQILAHLDIEVESRVRKLESLLANSLETFRLNQDVIILGIPQQVRGLTMREFGTKYNGDIHVAARGVQREKLGDLVQTNDIDKTTRKRIWLESQEAEAERSGHTSPSRAAKKARTKQAISPAKKMSGSSTGPGTTQRAHLQAASNKTPGKSGMMGRGIMASPSPNKAQSNTAAFRPSSPSKMRTAKPPSTTSFNPLLPKTPKYPAGARVPKRHESMLSLNGSPLANPYDLGMSWFNGGDKPVDDEADRTKTTNGPARGTLKRSKSIILVRRDPSFSVAPVDIRTKDMFSRTVSQPNLFPGPTNHSRTTPHPSNSEDHHTPKRPTQLRATTFPAAALVKIPTTDGHVLEFDPLQTSPGQIDALEGITDSAKRQAREEVGRLVQAAVSKWKIS